MFPCTELESPVVRSRVQLFTFGSYRLGVHGPGADIDTLCVAPRSVMFDDFFSSFPARLSAMPSVTSVVAIPEAFVPVIKLKCKGIAVDMVFARLNLTAIPPEFQLQRDDLLTLGTALFFAAECPSLLRAPKLPLLCLPFQPRLQHLVTRRQ
jgi:hypothetical protein